MDGRREVATYCRICEPTCGLVATVENDRITSVRGDKDNPLSQGFLCTKAPAMVGVTEDPDRVLRPLRRVGGPGDFEETSWDEAMDDIARRLQRIVGEHGPDAFASYQGNPMAFNSTAGMALPAFAGAVGSNWRYGVNGEDGASALVATQLMFGAPKYTKPDLWRTHMVLMLGANPFVSHGSMVTEPRIRQALLSIIERGGRVVVVDPRRTETAKQFEHVALIPGTDPWLLLGIIRSMLDRGLEDRSFLDAHAFGLDQFVASMQGFDVERCAVRCGVPTSTIHDLATALASAPSACVYTRTGACTQRFGTLTNYLQSAINVLTGNLEVPGGAVFGWSPFASRLPAVKPVTLRTRVRQLPAVVGIFPAQGLAADIVTPGDGQIRALLSCGANPVLAAPGGNTLAAALQELELHVSLDFYVNETNRHAHYILPTTTFFERADLPTFPSMQMLRPTMYATEAVVSARGEAREEWEILDELARRMGHDALFPMPPLAILDSLLQQNADGLSFKDLVETHPHGVALKTELPVRPLEDVIATDDKRCNLAADEIIDELALLDAHRDDPAFPIRMIGQREIRSHNTWMHNAERLMPDNREQVALVHSVTAADAGVADGDLLRIESRAGSIEVIAQVTDDVREGVVAVPHGWGHLGGWQRANAAGGANSNLVASTDLEDVERLAGMSILSGIPVRLSPVARGAAEPTMSSPGVTAD